MLKYKFDVMESLKEAGYSPARLRKEKLLGQGTIQKMRQDEMVSSSSIDVICRLLDMQPGNIIKYVEDEK